MIDGKPDASQISWVTQKPLDHWLYASRSLVPPHSSKAAIAQIVEISRIRNKRLGVTGALIFTGSFFAQYIEGRATGVEALKTSICNDVRHTDIRTISAGPTDKRNFGDWSLAYSGDRQPFDRLVSLAHKMPDQSGRTLLMEMIHRFASNPAL